jgi:Tfp pilus assembly protein PilE
MIKKNPKGMALIEILIGAAIISGGILAASSAYSTYIQYAFANQNNVGASYLMEEALEVMTFFRDRNWSNISNLSTTTTYYLSWSGSAWATSTTPQYVDSLFLRSINIEDVKRDGSDKISPSGTYDPNIKKITATISYWQGHATTTKVVSTYIANIQD